MGIKLRKGFDPFLVAVFCISICCSACAEVQAPEWHMVNVNATNRQGDAHLLIDNGVVVLIDTGQPEQTRSSLLPYLRQLDINKIDHLWISHPHTDHYAGINVLLEAGVGIDNIYYNQAPEGHSDFDYKPEEFFATLDLAKENGTQTFDINIGFRLLMPNSSMRVLFAPKILKFEGRRFDTNDLSLVVGWDANGHTALFTGDLNLNSGSILAKEEFVRADILKIPHHGVGGIAPNTFFDKVDPSVVMLPQPEILYRHPRGKQVKNWVNANLENNLISCRNGKNGTVVLTFIKQGVQINPERPSRICPQRTLNLARAELPFNDRENRFDNSQAVEPNAMPPINFLLLGD